MALTPEQRQARMDQLKAERAAAAAEKAKARAESNPMFNPTVRPEAPQNNPGFVNFYSWIGGGTTGQWRLYKEPEDSPKAASAAARSTGGPTQAKFGSAVGANTVPTPTAAGSATGVGAGGAGAGTGSGDRGPAVNIVDNGDGTVTYTYADGTKKTVFRGSPTPTTNTTTQQSISEKQAAGRSAYNLLFEQFDQFGLGALVEPLRGFIVEGLSPAEFTLRLRETDAYKKRFAANQSRIQKGLRALSEAEYIQLEDQYQNVMRNYGLPANYYTRGDMGRQEGFERFIAGDVSAAELEDRIVTAQNRVINAAPEVSRALQEFYPNITGGDILAYALDPEQALNNIKRKVTAAEIGAGAMQAGLATSAARAEELQRFGVTGEQARQGFQTIGSFLPRATQLSEIYADQGVGPFTQTTAEQEVFGTTGAVEAQRRRRKLAELETAEFSGRTGMAGSALSRERAGQF